VKTSTFVLSIVGCLLMGVFCSHTCSDPIASYFSSWVRNRAALQALIILLCFMPNSFPIWLAYVFPQCPERTVARRFALAAVTMYVLPIAGLFYVVSVG